MIRKFVRTLLLFVVLAVAVIAASLYIAATRWQSKGPVEVNVRPGSSVGAIARVLSDKGAIRTPTLFEFYVRIKGLGGKLKAGTYDIPAGTTMVAAVARLVAGDVRQYKFTIIEGWTIKDIAAALKEKSYIEDEKMPAGFGSLTHDKEFMKELGFEGASSLEGYLFPDTYRVAYPLEADEFIRRLVSHFNKVWNSLVKEGSGVNRPETITLASIVEKETGNDAERPLVAGVLVNRLKRGIALQSDPTIIYGLPHFDGNLRKRDISNPHPYNTYVHPGLPPGPICNPGRASIEAVLGPAKTDYLYFVSKNDGTHQFSKTLSEHLKAVRRYQIMGEGRR